MCSHPCFPHPLSSRESRHVVKHTKSKRSRGLVTKRIVFKNRNRPHDPSQELKVDLHRGERIEESYAAAMVAVRTSTPLADVIIVEISS